jgi:acetyl-CoA acetyltransferase
MTLANRAALVGVAEIAPTRISTGKTTLGLIAEVSAAAVADAGLEPGDIDGLLVGPHVGETPQHVPATVAEYLGLQPRFAELVDLGGASAAGMIWRAAAAISAGMCRTALCVLANIREPSGERRESNRNPIREFDVPYGASGANQAYAMIARRHMDEFGTTPEQLASIAVAERANAQLNPDAVFHGIPLTVEDVLASPYVAEPLHLLEIVMPCAGAAAVVVADARLARALIKPTVTLLGAGERVTHRALSQAPSLTTSPLDAAIHDAYRMAGLGPRDVDLLALYDCYTILVAITVEDAGLCTKGDGGRWCAERDLTVHGELPLNPHGGQLSFGQADLAGGMSHVTEAVRQLRAEAGTRQIPNAGIALITGNGATMSEATALVLGSAA